MTDKAAIWVSIGSMVVSIVSAFFSYRAQKQARKAAMLGPRTKAIERIRQAHFAITNNRFVADQELDNLREAKNLCELVFGREVQRALAQADSKARRLNGRADRKEQDFRDTLERLGEELQALLVQMNREAAVG
jgi:hypothetical protein